MFKLKSLIILSFDSKAFELMLALQIIKLHARALLVCDTLGKLTVASDDNAT